MAVEIILPKLGMDMQSGIIMTWYKNEGDTIKKGEPLFELMTDKVNIEVEAEDSGTLLKKFYETGVELPVFTTIGYLGTPGEKIPDKESMEIGLSSDTLSAEDRAALRSIRGGRHDGFSAGAKTVRATPAARRMALQNKVDLNTINGSGPKGRIQVEDVEEAIQSPKNIKKTEIPQQKVFVIDDEPKAEEVVEWIDGDKEVVENPGMKDSLDMTLEDLVARMSHSEEKIGEKAFGKIDAMDQEQEEKEKELEEKELEEQGQPEIEAVEKMPRQQAVLSPLAEKIVEVEKINIADIGNGSGPDGRIMKEDVLKAMETAAIRSTSKIEHVEPQLLEEIMDEAADEDETVCLEEKDTDLLLDAEVQELAIIEEELELEEEFEEPVERVTSDVEEKAEVIKQEVKDEEKIEWTIDRSEPNQEIEETSVQLEPLGAKRKIIAQRMVKSKHETAVITLTTEIDMTEVKDLRKKISKKVENETGCRCTYTDFLLVSVSRALIEHPYINSRLQDDQIILHDYVNLGLAVGMDDGLIVPVIKGTDNLSFSDMVVKRSELLKAVKNKKLTSDHFQGSTFTVTNLGMYGILEFTAIINQPNSAILSVGEVVDRVRIFKGEPTPRSVMKVSINLDHRVADGMAGAKFLQTVKAYMENPALLLF